MRNSFRAGYPEDGLEPLVLALADSLLVLDKDWMIVGAGD
jgi:hypothetical protein